MNNVIRRVLVFLIGLPILGAIVIFFETPYHIGFNLLIVSVSALSAVETSRLLQGLTSSFHQNPWSAAVFGVVVPAATFLTEWGFAPARFPSFALVVMVIFVLITGSFGYSRDKFSRIVPYIAASLFLLIYPGVFIAYGIRISTLPHATILIITFLAAVYLNDSLAYVTGKLFGRFGPRIFLEISPNKTLIGFIGGFAASPLCVLAAGLVFPEVFPGGVVRQVLFGSAIGLATIMGDLVESALKRSAMIKDSGSLIPGRGGILDSVDSPLFTAPVFFYLYVLFFTTYGSISL
jgi:phosphatidate cytidylyltransferase